MFYVHTRVMYAYTCSMYTYTCFMRTHVFYVHIHLYVHTRVLHDSTHFFIPEKIHALHLNHLHQTQLQIYKLISIGLCSNIAGQIMVDCMVKPPSPGEPSYDNYQKVNMSVYE
jgi:hypothetical protein